MLPEQEAKAIKDYMAGQMPKRPRFSGKKQWFILLLLLIAVGVIYVALNPWAFFMGGDFHPRGYWQGWGRMHSKTAGDYFLYVTISPFTPKTVPIIAHTFIKENGYICTPKDESFSLRVSGEMPPHIYLSTMGQPIRLGMSNWRDILPVGQESRPSFSAWGRWGKGEIVADDRKTLSEAFLPDGTLRPVGSHYVPAQLEDIQVTLHEGSYSQFKAACSATQQ